MKATNLIRHTLRGLGVIGTGQYPRANQAKECLGLLNELLETWRLERRIVSTIARLEFALVANQQTYTIGDDDDADVETANRPVGQHLEYAGVTPVGLTQELPLTRLTRQRWNREPLKALTATFPRSVYYEPTSPLGTLMFHPIPTTAATVVLALPVHLARFADLTTDYDLPIGYARAIRLNFKIEVAEEFGKPVTPLMMKQATDAKAAIERVNLEIPELESDPALLNMRGRGGFNIWTGN